MRGAVLTREVRTEIEIAAPPEAVWTVMAELQTWSEWNPVIAGMWLDGPLQAGTRGRLVIDLGQPAGPQSRTVRLSTVRPPYELA